MELRPCTEQDRQAVLDGLLAYNHRYLKPAVDLSCCVEQEGRIAAGILARLLEDCIYVEILWVDELSGGRGWDAGSWPMWRRKGGPWAQSA